MEINIGTAMAKTMTMNDDSDVVSDNENSSNDRSKRR